MVSPGSCAISQHNTCVGQPRLPLLRLCLRDAPQWIMTGITCYLALYSRATISVTLRVCSFLSYEKTTVLHLSALLSPPSSLALYETHGQEAEGAFLCPLLVGEKKYSVIIDREQPIIRWLMKNLLRII